MTIKDKVIQIFSDSQAVSQKTVDQNADAIAQCVDMICEALNSGYKLLFFGNGGSAADSQHIAAEFVGRFKKDRRAFAAIALTTDTSILTSLSNDYSYDVVFARQIEALGRAGDVAIGISTSGNSTNVIEGIKKASEMGLKTICLTGGGGGKLMGSADIHLDAPSNSTARIQEAHMCMYHAICELVEEKLSD